MKWVTFFHALEETSSLLERFFSDFQWRMDFCYLQMFYWRNWSWLLFFRTTCQDCDSSFDLYCWQRFFLWTYSWLLWLHPITFSFHQSVSQERDLFVLESCWCEGFVALCTIIINHSLPILKRLSLSPFQQTSYWSATYWSNDVFFRSAWYLVLLKTGSLQATLPLTKFDWAWLQSSTKIAEFIK